jgi:SAM-dependent methyltransferase
MMLMNLGAILVMSLSAGPADPTAPHGHGQGHGHGDHGKHANHGNPADFERYVSKLEDPERDAWQKPDEVVRALELRPGQVVCDIGVGTGYFARRFAAAVGPAGRVFGVDVEPRMLEALAQRLGAASIRNVTPVMGLPGDPLLPAAACDLIVVVDTYHHFPDGPAYLRRLGDALKPGGRLVNIDFHKRQLPVGPPLDHLVDRADFMADATRAGFTLQAEHTLLPHQYFLVLKLAPAPSK